jgi:hypothetical protein
LSAFTSCRIEAAVNILFIETTRHRVERIATPGSRGAWPIDSRKPFGCYEPRARNLWAALATSSLALNVADAWLAHPLSRGIERCGTL